MTTKLPTITHLQFLILNIIYHEERSSIEIQNSLFQCGIIMSHPSFHQLLDRMLTAGWVKRRKATASYKNRPCVQSFYTLTRDGGGAHDKTMGFYIRINNGLERYGL